MNIDFTPKPIIIQPKAEIIQPDELERAKQELALRYDFHLKQFFKEYDRKDKGYLDS